MSKENCTTAVNDQARKITELKAGGADKAALAPAIAELLALKAKFKEVTGEEFPKPVAAPKKAKAAPAAPAAAKGPSKKDLKKAAKAAGKDTKGSKAPVSAAKPAAAKGAGGLKLLAEAQDCSTLKCLFTAASVGTDMTASFTDSKSLPFGVAPVLEAEGTTLFGANAICRYLCLAKNNMFGVDDLAVDHWLEWEETDLSPYVAGKVSQELKDALNHANTSLGKSKFLVGDKLSLADLVVGPSVATGLGLLPKGSYAGLEAYTASLSASAAYKAGTKGLESVVSNKVTLELTGAANGDGNNGEGLLGALVYIFNSAIASAFPEAAALGIKDAMVQRASNSKFGEYQCNNAMAVFALVKGKNAAATNPRAVAQAIVDSCPDTPLIKKLEVAGPGFINIYLSTKFLEDRVRFLAAKGVLPPPVEKRTVAVDFSSPNIAKEMHVGHLRSTIIGDTICRILEFCGHKVHRVNHVGDWGTQFGMLICHLSDSFPDFKTNQPNLTDLTGFYKAAKARFDAEPEFKLRSQQGVVALQAGDEKSLEMWKILCDISRVAFEQVYSRLHVKVFEAGESFYNSRIPGIIEGLNKQGLITDSNGASCVFIPDHQVPLMVRKSDGGFGYDSTDITAINYRIKELGCDWIVYVTDAGQSDHFKLVFGGAKLAGWLDNGRVRLDHVGFGVVKGDDGKRFKTRSGETVRLVDLLDAAVTRMDASLRQRVADKATPLPIEDVPTAAAAIGYGAVKYFDLRQNPQTEYVFNYDRMLDVKGDTAVYLLQQYARICSMVRKSGLDIEKLKTEATISLEHDAEKGLAIELATLPDVILSVLSEIHMTHRICTFLYKLCTSFSEFYTQCKCSEDGKWNTSRLLLCEATSRAMFKCLDLLGITAIDQM